jgi:hypothetical protein
MEGLKNSSCFKSAMLLLQTPQKIWGILHTKGMQKWGHYVTEVCKIPENHETHLIHMTTSEESLRVLFFTRSLAVDLVTEITQPCIHTCDGVFICQLYLLPDLLEETDCKEDTPLTLPFASFISLSQLIIVI